MEQIGKRSNVSIAEEYALKIKREEQRNLFMQLMPAGLLIILILVFGMITPQFLTISNLYTNILTSMSILVIISVGATFIILMGAIDLSVEGVVGFAGCLLGLLVQNSANQRDLGWAGVIIAEIGRASCRERVSNLV